MATKPAAETTTKSTAAKKAAAKKAPAKAAATSATAKPAAGTAKAAAKSQPQPPRPQSPPPSQPKSTAAKSPSTAPSAAKATAKKAAAKTAASKAPEVEVPAKAAAPEPTAKAAKPAIRPATRGTVPSKPPEKAKTPEKSSAHFDKAFLDAQVKLLNKERITLFNQATTLKNEADALARDREPGDVQFDDESGEGDTLAVERDMDLARAASAMQTVDEIDAALERIEKGTYGICEYSGLAIPKERLKAIPYARERVEFKTRSFR